MHNSDVFKCYANFIKNTFVDRCTIDNIWNWCHDASSYSPTECILRLLRSQRFDQDPTQPQCQAKLATEDSRKRHAIFQSHTTNVCTQSPVNRQRETKKISGLSTLGASAAISLFFVAVFECCLGRMLVVLQYGNFVQQSAQRRKQRGKFLHVRRTWSRVKSKNHWIHHFLFSNALRIINIVGTMRTNVLRLARNMQMGFVGVKANGSMDQRNCNNFHCNA